MPTDGPNTAPPAEIQSGPAGKGQALTEHDTNILPRIRALYIGTGGDLHVTFPGSSTVVIFKNVQDGTLLPIAPNLIKAASTVADIVGVW